MRYVQAHGSFYEVGLKVGKTFEEDIPEMYERTVAYLLEHTSVGTKERIHQVAERHLFEARRLWEPSVEFLRGQAKGADVSMSMIALTSFTEEISSEFLPIVSSEKCSTLVVRTPDGYIMIIQNEDYNLHSKVAVFEVTFVGFPRLVCVAYIGQLLAGISLNARGVAITNNSLWPKAQPGLPKQVQHFRASLTRNLVEAVQWLEMQPIALTTHYVVACGRTREIVSLAVSNRETSAVNMDLRTISGPSFCHTNHVLDGRLGLKQPDPAIVHSKSSFLRYDKLNSLTPEELPQTPKEALDFFSNQDEKNVLFQSGKDGKSKTLVTTVTCPEIGEFWAREAGAKASAPDWKFSL